MSDKTTIVPFPEKEREEADRSIANRWTPKLAKQFCPVSSYFLKNYRRLKPHDGAKGLSNTEAMLIIHIMDHKWGPQAPWPTVKTLATRMSLNVRTVRAMVKRLEGLDYIKREPMLYGPNRYQMQPLFDALEKLMIEDAEEKNDSNKKED